MKTPVTLKALSVDDVDNILSWVNNATIVGNIAAFSGEPFTREQELQYVESILASKSDVAFSIFDEDGERYLGQIGIHQIHSRSKVGRLGCIVSDAEDMGKGVGSAAISQVLEIAFTDENEVVNGAQGDIRGLGLHKIWLMIFKENTRSHRTYLRLGFQDEGVLREEYFHQDGWHDMTRMSLLSDEWRDRNGANQNRPID